ncbi:MAG: methyltransferase domain-containing protein [Rhodospirillales bacterium]|nr:methyltransferase domain-containing protein [Rhodospirillales bacterium]
MIRRLAALLPPALREELRTLVRGPRKEGEEWLPYRTALFDELVALAGAGHFAGKRILEIGPRDGLDSRRLAGLRPAELVMLDLPEKGTVNREWLAGIDCPKRYIEANYLYMEAPARAALGRFDLVWFTGVLYHNAEQLRMLRLLFRQLVPDGWLVLESSTLRGPKALRDGAFVQIHWPQTFRDTGTITHLPSAGAVRAWLDMAGFGPIHDSSCFRKTNPELVGLRYAAIAWRGADDAGGAYYAKSGLNPDYRLGDAT